MDDQNKIKELIDSLNMEDGKDKNFLYRVLIKGTEEDFRKAITLLNLLRRRTNG